MVGRHRKNNADWFSHDADASSDEKLLYLEGKFKLIGYALYFKMLECLTRSNYFKLEWNEIKISIYASKFSIEESLLNDFINEATRSEVKAFIIEDGFIYCPGLIKRLQYLVDKREYNRDKAKNTKTISATDNSISVTEMHQTKQNKSTLEKSIKDIAKSVEPAYQNKANNLNVKNAVLSQLLKRGVSDDFAKTVVNKKNLEFIFRKIMEFDYVYHYKKMNIRNTSKFLIDSIYKPYDEPAGFSKWYGSQKQNLLNDPKLDENLKPFLL